MTAQHAQRQGKLVAHNLAASYGHGQRRPYKHHDLGFVVDLAGAKAAANPLRVPLSGVPAKVVTCGYHLWPCPPTGSGSPRTGCWTPCCHGSRCSSVWSRPPRCR